MRAGAGADEVNGEKHEPASVLALLELLQVTGAHITAEALNTQKKLARKLHGKGGDYTLLLKDNHKTLRKEIQAYFHKVIRDEPARLAVHEAVDGGHGRVARRTCRQLPVSDWVSGAAQWPGLKTVIEMERERHLPGRTWSMRYSTISVPCPWRLNGWRRAYGGFGR